MRQKRLPPGFRDEFGEEAQKKQLLVIVWLSAFLNGVIRRLIHLSLNTRIYLMTMIWLFSSVCMKWWTAPRNAW